MTTPPNLLIHEVNARLLLRRASAMAERSLTLGDLADKSYLPAGSEADYMWFMGVWARSRAARRVALRVPDLIRRYGEALADWREEDVQGSPYALSAYAVDPALGDPGDLRRLRGALNTRGTRLLVDFVPNHVAIDHPWISEHPGWFLTPDRGTLGAHPNWFFPGPDGVIMAHGRDPNFAPWTDTAQLNLFSTELREGLVEELLSIAERADGVRCDMAMLVLNDVFERTWGDLGKEFRDRRPPGEFWAEAIGRVRSSYPDFCFVAESFWRTQRTLLDLGFDYAYDKGLYDRFLTGDAGRVREYLENPEVPLDRAVHFLENHDEPRSAVVFGPQRARAAALATLTLPGARLLFDGQMEGRTDHLPVQLIREPDQPTDVGMIRFYEDLLRLCNDPILKRGSWQTLRVEPGADAGADHENLLAWQWQGEEGGSVFIIVNYSASIASGMLALPEGANRSIRYDWPGLCRDSGEEQASVYLRGGKLVMSMNPWQGCAVATG